MRMVRWTMGVSLLEHRRNEEILVKAKVEPIATVMRRRRLEWLGRVKRSDETENIRAVAETKMVWKRLRRRPKLRWCDTARRDLKAWKIKEEWATDRERWKGLCKNRYPEQGNGGERWESIIMACHIRLWVLPRWRHRPVIKLDTMRGRIIILSIRIRTSPGKEKSRTVSALGSLQRPARPTRNPRHTQYSVISSNVFGPHRCPVWNKRQQGEAIQS